MNSVCCMVNNRPCCFCRVNIYAFLQHHSKWVRYFYPEGDTREDTQKRKGTAAQRFAAHLRSSTGHIILPQRATRCNSYSSPCPFSGGQMSHSSSFVTEVRLPSRAREKSAAVGLGRQGATIGDEAPHFDRHPEV